MDSKDTNTQQSPWKWWAGDDEELYRVGPESARDAVIAAAVAEGLCEFLDDDGVWCASFNIVEARQDPLRLADWIGAEDLLDRADEELFGRDRVYSDCDDSPIFCATPEQERDLAERLRRACDEWQEAHGLVFTCNSFSASRNHEFVVVPLPPLASEPPPAQTGDIA